MLISFNGGEEDVIGLEGPHQAMGVYGQLVQEALKPQEVVRHFLLCPKWESRAKPFGLQAEHASHALCLTGDRLIAVRVYHGTRRSPVLLSIDRSSLIGFEFGEAILMSWMRLRLRREERNLQETFFFPRHGNHLVAALLRTWRESWPTGGPRLSRRPSLSRGDVLREAGYFHERLLAPLLLPEETCLKTDQRSPIWGTRRFWLRLSPVGLASRGSLLSTDRSFFYVHGQPPLGRTGYVFAHNLSCFSLAELHHVENGCRPVRRATYPYLALTFAGPGGPNLEILFPEEQAPAAPFWTRELRA